MISAKPMAVVAMLAFAGGVVGQEEAEEQRINELIGRLKGHDYQQAASWELVRIGAPAVPALIDVLGAESSVPLNLKVVATLGRMRAEAASALPAIMNLLSRNGVARTALEAVGDIGPYAALDHSKLGESLTQAFWSSPAMGAVGDHSEFTRTFGSFGLPNYYVRAVSRLEIDPGCSTDLLIELLRSDNPFKVGFAAQLLGERSTEASRLVPHLERCAEEARSRPPEEFVLAFEGSPSLVLKKADWREVYFAAAEALARIAPLTPQAIPGHRLRLSRGNNVDLTDRFSSVAALVSMGLSAVEAVPELLVAARATDVSLAREAITVLGMIGPAAKDAIRTLEKLTEHEDPQIAERAKAALRQVRGR